MGFNHQVYLDAYYMDKYEVTNAMYKVCVDARKCTPPKLVGSSTHPSYYGNTNFNNYPVIFVDWYQSHNYCQWRGAKLPTSAQWEKAASGTDGREFPWGDYNPDRCDFANLGGDTQYCVGDTTEVGSYESGKSPYGIYDLIGNVFEWVADWYSWEYNQNAPLSNPTGPEAGTSKVIRGGSWHYYGTNNWVERSVPNTTSSSLGFRCIKDVNP